MGFVYPAFAGVTFGDANHDAGALTVSATLRAKYGYEKYGDGSNAGNAIKFDAAILNLDYNSPKFFGNVQWRCYEWSELCDFSTLVSAYAGYSLNKTDHITLGLQPIPFGPTRYWDTSFYAGLNTQLGLQDTLDLGTNYHFELPTATKVDLAYFVRDGGHYTGTGTKDAAHYTSNMIETEDLAKTSTKEKNIFVGRVKQDLTFLNTDEFKVAVGGSYLRSTVDNKRVNQDGKRDVWALFSILNYKNLAVTLTGGKQKITNEDNVHPDFTTFGSFDSADNIANKGTFYSVDSNYVFKNVWNNVNITPYLVFSGFNKDKAGWGNSQRNIVGAAFDYKDVSLYTEYVMGKNDNFIGGNANSLAQGDDGKWNKLVSVRFLYNF